MTGLIYIIHLNEFIAGMIGGITTFALIMFLFWISKLLDKEKEKNQKRRRRK